MDQEMWLYFGALVMYAVLIISARIWNRKREDRIFRRLEESERRRQERQVMHDPEIDRVIDELIND